MRKVDYFNLAFISGALIYAILFRYGTAHADEFGLRLGSAISPQDNAVVQFPTGSNASGDYEGKLVNLVYDWEVDPNFYLEGAAGYRSPSDIFEFATSAYEVSPGFRVTAGYFVLRLSEGISYMPGNTFNPYTWDGYQPWDFVTHLTFGLRDPRTGMGVYLDRSHYSNGSAANNPSLNYAGFMLLFPL